MGKRFWVALGLGSALAALGGAVEPLRFEWSGEVPIDGAATVGQLDNGLHYFILPHREPPGRVSLRLIVGAGSLAEREDQRGVAHFLEHIAFCGSENFSKGDLIEYLQRMGMKFGSHSNAYTSFTETVYMLELPQSDRHTVKEGLLVLRDYLGALTIAQEEVDRERGVILSEIQHRDSPQYRDALAYYDFLFPHSVLGKRFPLGDQTSVGALSAAKLREFYEHFYVPASGALVLVGDLDPAAAERAIKFLFGDVPAGPDRAAWPVGSFAVAGTRIKLHREPELPQVHVDLCCLRPLENFQDSRATREEKLLQCLGSAILTRRLEILSKELSAPFIEGSAEVCRPIRQEFQLAVVQLSVLPERICEAVRVAERELRRALEYGFTEGEAERARREMASQYRNARLQAQSLHSSSVAGAWVSSICAGLAPTSLEWNDDFVQGVLKNATAQRIGEAFQRAWAPTNRTIYVAGNLPEELTENSIRSTYFRSRRSLLKAPPRDCERAFAYEDFGPAGQVLERSEDRELGLQQLRFANGLRLNFKRTDFEAGQLQLRVRFGRGLLSQPEDRPGLSRFAEWAFSEGGLGKHSMEELRDLTAGHVLSADFSVGSNAFYLDGNTTAEDLPLQLQLLAAYLSDPGFRPEGEAVARKIIPQVYAGLDQTAKGALRRHGERFLHCGDGRFGYPDQGVMESYTMDDLRRWLEPELRDGYLEISIVGDGDPERVEKAVAATFGALPMRKGAPGEIHVPMELPRGQRADIPFDSEIPKGLVLVHWPTDDRWNIPQKRHLDLLASVLEDRLRVRVRKEAGDTYSPYAYQVSSAVFDHYGYICAAALVDVARIGEVARMIHRIGQELQKSGPTADEFLRISRPALTEVRELLRKNSYWLQSIDGCQACPELLEYVRTVLPFYENVQMKDLDDGRRFFNEDDAITITIRPKGL
ncbi:MAG: insulinase family protein [Puniceicoccales bacterium]|jgi:zinc protease|nr:insulinase family protein [Puniceicoccales bacterium]